MIGCQTAVVRGRVRPVSDGRSMNVIHRSDTLLMLEDRPWVFGLFLIFLALIFAFGGMAMTGAGQVLCGAFFALFGAGVPILISALMVRRVRLSFDRTTGQIARTARSVRALRVDGYALDRLRQATVGVSYDSDGNTYRIELRLSDPDEVVPFTSYHTNCRKPEAMAGE